MNEDKQRRHFPRTVMMVGLSTVKRPKAVNPMGALLSCVRKVVIYTGKQVYLFKKAYRL